MKCPYCGDEMITGGSRISNAEQELKKAYPNLNWQKGRLMNGATKEEIKQWTKK